MYISVSICVCICIYIDTHISAIKKICYMYIISFLSIHLLMSICFHILAVVNNAIINMNIYLFFFNIYLFGLLYWVLVLTHGVFDLCCGLWTSLVEACELFVVTCGI